MEHSAQGPPAADDGVDVDALITELRLRVDVRRSAGEYPPGFEDDLAEHFRRILRRRTQARDRPDLRGALAALEAAMSFDAGRIPVDSDLPGGQVLHRAVARAVSRQTQGILEQMQAFATPVVQLLGAVVEAIESLDEEVREDVTHRIDTILERQALQERDR